MKFLKNARVGYIIWYNTQENPILDQLVQNGDISAYVYENLDENGLATKNDEVKGMRNTERVVLTFPSGNVLYLNMICSGSMENVSMIITSKKLDDTPWEAHLK